MIYVIGHKNPDSDSVISALMFSRYLSLKGKEAVPVLPGKINKETEFIFSYFQEELPVIFSEEFLADKKVFLVDHNDLSQSLAKVENVYGVLDHHLISGLKTDSPIFFRVEPVGSTSSLVYKMFKEANLKLNKKEAGIVLAGIISDTLNLKSPTTTQEDVEYYQELVEISKENTIQLSEKMFTAKSDFSDRGVRDVLFGDLKEFSFGDKRVVIAIAETTSLSYFNNNEENILLELKNIKKENNYDTVFFGVIDIVNQNTHLYPAENEESEIIKNIFKTEKINNYFLLKGISSRKKEIAPLISEYYSK